MRKRFTISGVDFIRMVEAGARQLEANVDKVNALNVFPVPDGDTGTNMNLTMTVGAGELRKRPSDHLGQAAEVLAKGLLMGARGNSGVILSQLFRGFAKALAHLPEINARQLAEGLQHGVDMAYKAVGKPVEGTILTVAKEAARHGGQLARRTDDIQAVMQEVLRSGKEALAHTPELLPVLKQVGVVDSGGQGLIYIYEGFAEALSDALDELIIEDRFPSLIRQEPGGIKRQMPDADFRPHRQTEAAHIAAKPIAAQAHLATEDIEYGYCTEFIVSLNPDKLAQNAFNEGLFRSELSQFGDSLVVVADEDLVKVHIHAEYPGSVMNLAQKYGELSRIKIENMRDQHTHILEETAEGADSDREDVPYEVEEPAQPDDGGEPQPSPGAEAPDLKRYGFVAVSIGEGLAEVFRSMQVDEVLFGGQTMNPSTEDIARTIGKVNARTVFVLPNNSNIIMGAEQAVELVEDKQVIVIPSKSIPQGIAAILAFNEEAAPEENADAMQLALQRVQSAAVTYAVRDTQMDGIDIKQGQYIGILNGKIVIADTDCAAACKGLLDRAMEDGAELVTLYPGQDADEDTTSRLVEYMEERHGDVEVEVVPGGQPLYYYIISVE